MIKVYNKAIRDKIPQIIMENGHKCEYEVLDDKAFLKKMEKKLEEEIAEYNETRKIEELVDIIEVIYRISELKGISKKNLEKMRVQKNVERGAFLKNYFLIKTER